MARPMAEDHGRTVSPAAINALPGAAALRRSRARLARRVGRRAADVAPYKRDPMDFVLWKPSKPNEPGWPSPAAWPHRALRAGVSNARRCRWRRSMQPFGGGLECDDPSHASTSTAGASFSSFHHENEIAQSYCAFGSKRMANIWMHNGFLQVEGEKMAASATA